MRGKVVSINVSDTKGVRKGTIKEANIVSNYGIEGDAHASSEWHRQISLLAMESILKMQELGLDVGPGDFAENITTEGIDLIGLSIGARIDIGDTVELEITQKGKTCHSR